MTGPRLLRIRCGSVTLLGAALLAGCGSPATVGTPASRTDPANPISASETSAAPPVTSGELAGIKPAEVCDLLDEHQRETLRLTAPGISSDVGGNPSCRWRAPQVTAVLTVLADGFNVDQVPTAEDETVRGDEIDGRRARIFTSTDPSAGCTVYVDLTRTSYLEVATLTLSAGEGLIDECAFAKEIATIATTTLTAGRPR